MIAEGRGKLEWERKIPDEKLEELKALLAAPEFKANMAKVNTTLFTQRYKVKYCRTHLSPLTLPPGPNFSGTFRNW